MIPHSFARGIVSSLAGAESADMVAFGAPSGNGWGNNPATFEAISAIVTAVGVLAVFASTVLAWRALHETKAQRDAIEREMAARLRPWVGLFAFGLEVNPWWAGRRAKAVILQLRNFGPLPAQDAQLHVRIAPLGDSHQAIVRSEAGVKALMPNEDGNYRISLAPYPQFALWERAKLDVVVEGRFTYAHATLSLGTDFEARLWFSERRSLLHLPRITWRNKTAT